MGRHSPCVPYSALFLLLLLLLPAQLSRAQSSGWRASHPHYPNSAHFYNYRVRQARQNVNQVDDVLQYCDGAFDVYYLLDSPNLRMSFIVFNTRSRIELMLTSNRTAIYHRLVALENIPTSGEIYLQKAFRQANEQIARANSGAKRVSSMIIAVVSGPLRLDVFNETMIEARTARTMGAYIYLIGVDNYSTFQLKAIADSPEHVFGIHGALRNLHGRVDYVQVIMVNSSLRAATEYSSLTHTFECVLTAAKQVVLKGYGFHNARSRNQVICRFKFSNNVAIDEHPIRMNMTTITCPTPQAVQPGQNITVEVSLNNGRDFLARSIRVEATADCDSSTSNNNNNHNNDGDNNDDYKDTDTDDNDNDNDNTVKNHPDNPAAHKPHKPHKLGSTPAHRSSPSHSSTRGHHCCPDHSSPGHKATTNNAKQNTSGDQCGDGAADDHPGALLGLVVVLQKEAESQETCSSGFSTSSSSSTTCPSTSPATYHRVPHHYRVLLCVPWRVCEQKPGGSTPGPGLYPIMSHGSEASQHWHHSQRETDCWGSFDLYFILDNPNLRMSFIVFSRTAEVIMPLTGDRDEIHSGLNRLQRVVPGGYTYMQEGFKEANEQIMRYHFGGKKVASVIIVLTDGMLMKDPFEKTKQEADKSRNIGAVIYTVGVLDYDKDQMVALADTPGHMFGVDSGFEGLQDIVDSETGVWKVSTPMSPPPGGAEASSDPILALLLGSPVGTMGIRGGRPQLKSFLEIRKLSVDLSLNNGASFIGNKFNITSTECVNTKSRPMVRQRSKIKPYLKFLPALLLIPLLLCCCWCLWRRKDTKEPSPTPPDPEMEPEEEKLPPPPPPLRPPLTQQPPPPPPPINTSPTVIVSCCGCGGGRTIEGRHTNITLMNPHCGQASCVQKICLHPNRKCYHIAQTQGTPRICLQPNRECFSIPEVEQEGVTVKGSSHFNPDPDAETLYKAMKGIGTNEQAIIDVLTKRNNAQRQQIAKSFKAQFGKDLTESLKSELSGKFERLIVALMYPPYKYEAKELHDAMEGLGTKEGVIIEILASRTKHQLQEIMKAYEEDLQVTSAVNDHLCECNSPLPPGHKGLVFMPCAREWSFLECCKGGNYGSSLEEDIQGDTSGYLERILVCLLQGNRDDISGYVDPALAVQDAQDLYAAGEKISGTDEMKFITILCTRSATHLMRVFKEYENIANKSIEDSIKSETHGSLEEAMLTVVKCTRNLHSYFAERLYYAMKGAGTRDGTLIRNIVSRSETDLNLIKCQFSKMYGKSLSGMIMDDTSGDYKNALLNLVGSDP
ncbi:Annexin A8 [Fukomys damarensis]|uniref:Annexin n=1 Tax=Fukomys damarensis TaxID=885580 RepID=A0A091DUM1_FUKDA|nr:Annexin A8 [Fukomys damarensis]